MAALTGYLEYGHHPRKYGYKSHYKYRVDLRKWRVENRRRLNETI